MATDIKIYQGNQIGGCITVISTGAAKIVIDFGESLPGAEIVENIDFDWKNEKVDAVFFTHYHGDHIGRFMEIPDSVPLYMGKVTWEVLRNLNIALHKSDVVDKLETRSNIHFIEPQKAEQVGDIIVTPYSVDHSAFDAYMFLVETPEKNILHTGDYRDHGHRGHKKRADGTDMNVMLEVIRKYVKKDGKRQINTLITEGTMLGTRKDERRYSEKQMLRDAKKLFSEHKYVFLKISSTNVDSMASFYHAARENGMGFYANKYVISQLDTFSKYGRKYTSFYDFKDTWPILPKPNENSSEKHRTSYAAQREHMRNDGFVMLVSEYEYYDELMEEFSDLNPIMIYSLWKGYINKEIGKGAYNPKLAEFCERHNAIDMHTGGHAYPEMIEAVIKVTGAKEIIPIHTENAGGIFELDVKKTWRSKMIEKFKRRALSQEFIDDLLDGPLTPVLDRVKKDDTLCLELRGSFIDIYYRGGTLYCIQSTGNHQYRITYNENYNTEKDIDTKSATPIEILSVDQAVEEVPIHKQTMDFYFAKHQKLEREFQQLILRENNNSGKVTDSTDYYILDIEYAFNGSNESGDEISARYDMLAVRWASEGSVRKKTQNLPITFIEVKYGDGAMGSGADVSISGVHKHINDYINFRKDSSMLAALAEDMAEVFNQKHKLGLISSYQDKVDELKISLNANDVEFLFALANHDPAKGKLLNEIEEAIEEWKDKPEEKYLSEIRVAVSSLIGYGLHSFDKDGNNRYPTIKEFCNSNC